MSRYYQEDWIVCGDETARNGYRIMFTGSCKACQQFAARGIAS